MEQLVSIHGGEAKCTELRRIAYERTGQAQEHYPEKGQNYRERAHGAKENMTRLTQEYRSVPFHVIVVNDLSMALRKEGLYCAARLRVYSLRSGVSCYLCYGWLEALDCPEI